MDGAKPFRVRVVSQLMLSIVSAFVPGSACSAQELLPAGTKPGREEVETIEMPRIVGGQPPLYWF
jgi:hypothetical protein